MFLETILKSIVLDDIKVGNILRKKLEELEEVNNEIVDNSKLELNNEVLVIYLKSN